MRRAGERDTLAGLGEDALVRAIISGFGPPPPGVRVGPGDDAAVLDLAGPGVVASTDTLVEGQDFHREWSTGHDVGVKVAAQTMADIAAMGGRPVALLVSLAAPAGLPVAFARDLAAGLADECARAGAAVVGGDVSAAEQVVLTGTALGVLDGVEPVRRNGARPGDLVALAGRTGLSAAGLALLRAGVEADSSDAAGVLIAHRAPRPDYRAGPIAAAAGASALIDVSDGLLRDAARIGLASGVLLDIARNELPDTPELAAVATLLGRPELADAWRLTGGEDHAFLACFPPRPGGSLAPLPEPFVPVGRVRPADSGQTGKGSVLLDGEPFRGSLGWQHWEA